MTDISTASTPTGGPGDAEQTTAPAQPRRRSGGGLSGKVLAELQQIAGGLGIKGTGKMRKSALIEAITAAQGDSSSGGRSNGATGASAAATAPAEAPAAKAAGSKRARAGSSRPSRTVQTYRATTRRASRAPVDAPSPVPSPETTPGTTRVPTRETVTATTTAPKTAAKSRSDSRSESRTDNRTDSRSDNRTESRSDNRNDSRSDNRTDTRNDNRQRLAQRNRGGSNRRDEEGEGGSRRRRRSRNRDRGRDRDRGGRDNDRGRDSEPQVHEDDVLLPVAGILDVLDNYAFVRTSGYLPGPDDVYVSLSMVRKCGLRKGDAVTGQVKQAPDRDRKEKFNPLVRIDTVNGADVDSAKQRLDFSKLTPLYAQERLRLETEASILTTRIIDIVAPIGKGQRGLIVSPSKAGKTLVLQSMANAITTNNPEVHLMVVLVDERPEEVTDMQRAVKGEVIASTFDRPADDHTTVAELAIERAKRLVELGHDVVVLLDSITRLGRAYNLAAPASGRILSGGVDSSALYPPKRFFGAARNIEDGGSLTILATALIETGSKMDEVIFEEFKGTGNMELRLRREFADKRIFPAIDVDSSGTRREELLMSREELQIVWKLRRVLSALDGQQALELIIDKLKKTKSNVEFLTQVRDTMPMQGNGRRDDG